MEEIVTETPSYGVYSRAIDLLDDLQETIRALFEVLNDQLEQEERTDAKDD